MGCWAWPQTDAQIEEFKKGMSKPVPYRYADRVFYSIVGDDDVYDLLDEVAQINPKADCRKYLASLVAEKTYEGKWNTHFPERQKLKLVNFCETFID